MVVTKLLLGTVPSLCSLCEASLHSFVWNFRPAREVRHLFLNINIVSRAYVINLHPSKNQCQTPQSDSNSWWVRRKVPIDSGLERKSYFSSYASWFWFHPGKKGLAWGFLPHRINNGFLFCGCFSCLSFLLFFCFSGSFSVCFWNSFFGILKWIHSFPLGYYSFLYLF